MRSQFSYVKEIMIQRTKPRVMKNDSQKVLLDPIKLVTCAQLDIRIFIDQWWLLCASSLSTLWTGVSMLSCASPTIVCWICGEQTTYFFNLRVFRLGRTTFKELYLRMCTWNVSFAPGYDLDDKILHLKPDVAKG